jgi:glycine/D-amino acid oxidase-like deaminating enzyme
MAAPAKLASHRTYLIGTNVPRGSAPRALYWDTADPCHYVRVDHLTLGNWQEEAYDVLIVGGEDHQTQQAEDAQVCWARLEDWARQRFPMISQIDYRWADQVTVPIDGLAFIGPNPMDEPNVYVTAGDTGKGMTHGTIAGLLLTDLMCGRENQWAHLYDPRRSITLGAIDDFAQQRFNFDAQFTRTSPKDSSATEHPLCPPEAASSHPRP